MTPRVRTREWSGVDYYTVLGLTRYASSGEIDDAYRARAKALHPDRNPGDRDSEEEFKAVVGAYAVLRDPASRAAYDDFRTRVNEGSLYARSFEHRWAGVSTPVGPASPPWVPPAGTVRTRPARRRTPRTWPRWSRLLLGWSLVGAGLVVLALLLVIDVPTQGPDSKAAVLVTLGIVALKLVIGGAIVLLYPRLRARWHRPPPSPGRPARPAARPSPRLPSATP